MDASLYSRTLGSLNLCKAKSLFSNESTTRFADPCTDLILSRLDSPLFDIVCIRRFGISVPMVANEKGYFH